MGGWTKTKLMLNSTQVEVEVGVELGQLLKVLTDLSVPLQDMPGKEVAGASLFSR